MSNTNMTASPLEIRAATDALIRMNRLVPVDGLRCPVCGTSVKWSCGIGEHPTGRADCENGRMVSRRDKIGTPSCPWPGTPVVRLGARVLAPLPLEGAADSAIVTAARELLKILDAHEDATDAIMGDAYHEGLVDSVYDAKTALRAALPGEAP